MNDSPVVTRFAPSPTGHLHVGGARTALLNWAYARGRGGRFLLRIEDTDQTRSTEAAERAILEDLKWLGLDWDNAGDEPRQSQRLDLYNDYMRRLLEAGLAYEDDGAVRFRMPDRDIVVVDQVLGEVRVPAGQTEDFVIRKSASGGGFPTYHFAVVVDDADMGVTHVIRGQEHLSNAPKHVALQQALGLPTPIYAHIPLIFNPDGSKMSKRDKAKVARQNANEKIQDGVIDAEGLYDSVKEFLALPLHDSIKPIDLARNQFDRFLKKENDEIPIAEAIAYVLKIELPEINVNEFKWNGYLPEPLCNYLALLGWNPGNDIEKFDNAFLCEHFDFDRVGKKNAKFDREKLRAFNGDAIRALDSSAWRHAVWNLPSNSGVLWNCDLFSDMEHPVFATFCEAYQQRSETLRDPLIMGKFFFQYMIENYDDKAVQKNLLKNDGEGLNALRQFRDELMKMTKEEFTGQAAHELIKSFCERMGIGMGKVAQPLRIAVSGSAVTPPIDLTLDILGRDTTLARIDRCLETYAAHA